MRIACQVQGDGPPVALVSGLAQVGARWRPVAARLVSDSTVVTFDNRETGATGPCPDGFTLRDCAADVLEVMTDLGHERFFLGGWSMGGMIAQEIVRAAPERVRALVLLSTHGGSPGAIPADPTVLAPRGPVTTPDERLIEARGLWTRLSGPGFGDAHPEVIDEMAQISVAAATPLDGVLRQLLAIAAFDPGDALADCGIPVAVAHGDHDALVPYENGVHLAKRLGCELVTYKGAGHAVEFERPDDVTALLRRTFINGRT